MKKVIFCLTAFLYSSANGQGAGFAPINGDTMTIAKRVILVDAEQPCGKVVTANRDSKGYIIALCSNNEKYIVAQAKNAPMKDGTRKDVPIALRCSKAKELFNLVCS